MGKGYFFILVLLIGLSLFLTACGTGSEEDSGSGKPVRAQLGAAPDEEIELVEPVAAVPNEEPQAANLGNWIEEAPKQDDQGAVSVVITPLNLNQAWEPIDFRVKMNTHSVDLSMDLANLATLSTDTGHTVQAFRWQAPGGGHHVDGTLSFPVNHEDNQILEAARKITLTLVEIDAPQRQFTWER